MSGYRPVARLALTWTLALSLSACLMDSGSGSSQDGATSDSGVSIAIESPTSAARMDTTDETVQLAGTAASELGLTRVSWRNDRGGEGSANGTSNWQTGDIALELGENTLTVTAVDAEGNTHSRNLVVNRESGQTGSVTLSWEAPTTREDGTALDDLAGYTIYYGRMAETYDYRIDIDNPGVQTYVVDELVSGDWYFAMSARDGSGTESDRSNEVVRKVL